MLGAKNIRKLVYLMVSAETAPDITQYTLNEIPGLSRVSRALIDIPINRYSMDTMQLMNRAIQQWHVQLRQRPEGVSSVFAPDADIYFINASLTEVTDPEEEARLMNIATNLALTDEEVDHLLLAGSRLLRNDPEFQRLMQDLADDARATSQSPTPIQTP
jgi:NTE family protein